MNTFTVRDKSGVFFEIEFPETVSYEAFSAMVDRYNASHLAAPVEIITGAPLAQTGAPVAHGPPKGTGTGATSAPVRRVTGAPVAQVPLGGPVSSARKPRVEYLRDEVKSLATEKALLAPQFDAHEAALKSARQSLKDSHNRSPAIAGPEVTAQRMVYHDAILSASIQWGMEARRYREITALISTLTTEIDRIQAKEGGA